MTEGQGKTIKHICILQIYARKFTQVRQREIFEEDRMDWKVLNLFVKIENMQTLF